jgi:hypothetical protein
MSIEHYNDLRSGAFARPPSGREQDARQELLARQASKQAERAVAEPQDHIAISQDAAQNAGLAAAVNASAATEAAADRISSPQTLENNDDGVQSTAATATTQGLAPKDVRRPTVGSRDHADAAGASDSLVNPSQPDDASRTGGLSGTTGKIVDLLS